jgi:hypothetical protein
LISDIDSDSSDKNCRFIDVDAPRLRCVIQADISLLDFFLRQRLHQPLTAALIGHCLKNRRMARATGMHIKNTPPWPNFPARPLAKCAAHPRPGRP